MLLAKLYEKSSFYIININERRLRQLCKHNFIFTCWNCDWYNRKSWKQEILPHSGKQLCKCSISNFNTLRFIDNRDFTMRANGYQSLDSLETLIFEKTGIVSFTRSTNLRSIVFPKKVNSIGKLTFETTSISEIELFECAKISEIGFAKKEKLEFVKIHKFAMLSTIQ